MTGLEDEVRNTDSLFNLITIYILSLLLVIYTQCSHSLHTFHTQMFLGKIDSFPSRMLLDA